MANLEMEQFFELMKANPPKEGTEIPLINSKGETVTGIVGKDGKTFTIDGQEYSEEEVKEQFKPAKEAQDGVLQDGQQSGSKSIGSQIETNPQPSVTNQAEVKTSGSSYTPSSSSPNKISYNEDSINEYSKRVKEYAMKVEERQKKMNQEYKGLTSHGVCVETMNDLNNNFSSIVSVGLGTANSFAKHGGEMFNFDKTLASEINDLFIPQDFVENNSIEINTYNVSILNKIDGQSINEGQKTEKANEIDDSVVAAQALTNINDDQTKKQEYDDTTVVGESILGNISGDQTKKQDYDSSTSIGNTRLGNVTGEQAKQEDYDSSSSIQQEGLKGVKKDQTQKQDYDASTVIGESILGNINTDNNETQKQKIDDDAIAAAIDDKQSSYEKDEKMVSSYEENKKE